MSISRGGILHDSKLDCEQAKISAVGDDLVLCGKTFSSNGPIYQGNEVCNANVIWRDSSGNVHICAPNNIVFGPGNIGIL